MTDRSRPSKPDMAAEQAAARRREQRTLLIAVLAFVMVVVGGGIGFQAWRTGRSPAASPPPAAQVSFAPVAVADGKPLLLGAASARTTVTLYEDFHCPHCADFEEKFGSTIAAAQNAGTAKVELYPMAFIDSGSIAAANAMACAAEAGFGQGYYLGLFANSGLVWRDPQLIALAGQVGGRADDGFRSCITNRSHAGWVTSINDVAAHNGVNQTPTMLIDGRSVDISTLTVDGLTAQLAGS